MRITVQLLELLALKLQFFPGESNRSKVKIVVGIDLVGEYGHVV